MGRRGSIILTPRENQVAERIAWGASQKEAADDLGISRFTVDNILRSVYRKLGIGKINELSAWWFCTNFDISFDLSPLKRTLGAIALVCVFLVGEAMGSTPICRNRIMEYRIERTARRVR